MINPAVLCYKHGPNKGQPRIAVDTITGCWNWLGGKDPQGYGQMCYEGRDRPAHVVAYILSGGIIPEGKELDHICRNRGCANPMHVEPVTRIENIRRGIMPKLTLVAVADIRNRASTVSRRELAKLYGVNVSQIARVLGYTTWR